MAPNILEPLSLFTGPFSATLWPRAARAKGPGQGKLSPGVDGAERFSVNLPNQVLTHAARAAAKQPLCGRARRARRALVRSGQLSEYAHNMTR